MPKPSILRRRAFIVYLETNQRTDNGINLMAHNLKKFCDELPKKCHLIEIFDGDNRITIGKKTLVNSALSDLPVEHF